ncbi:MAG: hypothetical protein KME40_30860 [Komarekiella atlantica HA4396-MV6]|nr:hypothetical protein [Komarekiella atlantica HA4396-MV6]
MQAVPSQSGMAIAFCTLFSAIAYRLAIVSIVIALFPHSIIFLWFLNLNLED